MNDEEKERKKKEKKKEKEKERHYNKNVISLTVQHDEDQQTSMGASSSIKAALTLLFSGRGFDLNAGELSSSRLLKLLRQEDLWHRNYTPFPSLVQGCDAAHRTPLHRILNQ